MRILTFLREWARGQHYAGLIPGWLDAAIAAETEIERLRRRRRGPNTSRSKAKRRRRKAQRQARKAARHAARMKRYKRQTRNFGSWIYGGFLSFQGLRRRVWGKSKTPKAVAAYWRIYSTWH